MWIIKNRVTGEYERKGMSGKRDKVRRNAWDTIGQAKCHVAYKGFDEWFIDADFIEITEDGTGKVLPVVDYLREYYKSQYEYADVHVLEKLGLILSTKEE